MFFAEISGSAGYNDLAAIMTSLLEDQDNAQERLSSVLNDKNNALRAKALINLAVLQAKSENYNQAIETLDEILSSEKVPQSLVQKANALKHIYIIENNQ